MSNPDTPPKPAGSMYNAWAAFVDIRRDRFHEFPTYEDWILSNDPECQSFRQGWAAMGAILRDPDRCPDPIDFSENAEVTHRRQTPMNNKTPNNSNMTENDRQVRGDKTVESTALFGLLADIREAVGDPTGKLMQDELVERCRLLRECAEYVADKERPAWKSGGRGIAVAKASRAISWPNA